jgi:Ca2+-dependent lipid-binding protein
MQFAASHLDKKDFFGKSDPYFILSRATGNGQWTVVAKSSIVYNTLEPTWPLITVPVRDLCNGDYARQLKMDVYDHDEHTKDDLIGTLKVTLKDLTTAVGQRTRFPCVNPSKMSKRNYSDSGKVTLSFFKLEAKINFKTSL